MNADDIQAYVSRGGSIEQLLVSAVRGMHYAEEILQRAAGGNYTYTGPANGCWDPQFTAQRLSAARQSLSGILELWEMR